MTNLTLYEMLSLAKKVPADCWKYGFRDHIVEGLAEEDVEVCISDFGKRFILFGENRYRIAIYAGRPKECLEEVITSREDVRAAYLEAHNAIKSRFDRNYISGLEKAKKLAKGENE